MNESIKINLNEHIKVRLTEYGQQIYRAQWEELNQAANKIVVVPHSCKVDKDGMSEFQLWDFIETFGSYIGMCKRNVINPIEIIYQLPKEVTP